MPDFRAFTLGLIVPALAIAAVVACPPAPARAQEAEPIGPPVQAGPPERIDLLAQSREIAAANAGENGDQGLEDCSEVDEATLISGEILVCRRRRDDSAAAGFDKKAWEERYAAETRGADPVDTAGPGIFRGAPTIGSLCIPGLQKCPPPPAIMIDVSALPQAPPGSDADRIARGLAPLGRDTANDPPAPPGTPASRADALGLPPVPDFAPDGDATAVNPEGSAAPAAPR